MIIIPNSIVNMLEEEKGTGYMTHLMSTRIPNFEISLQDIHTSSKNYDESCYDLNSGFCYTFRTKYHVFSYPRRRGLVR